MVSLPNIICGKFIVPEILQGDVTVRNISYNIEKLLYDNAYRTENIAGLQGVKELLFDKVSSIEAAEEIAKALAL